MTWIGMLAAAGTLRPLIDQINKQVHVIRRAWGLSA